MHKLSSCLISTTALIFGFGTALIGASTPAAAQTIAGVENLTSVPSTQILDGLGFNADPSHQWEFQAAKDCGAVEVRFQPGWNAVSDGKGNLRMPAADDAGLDLCGKIGLQPLLVAAYGPPWKLLVTVHVAQDVPIGAYRIPVTEAVDAIVPPACQIMGANRSQITARWAYGGSLIDAVDTANKTLVLASATTMPLKAGDALIVNQYEFPSCATSSATDPSVIEYAKYATFLADQVGAHTANRPNGLIGRVELWNEPPWPHDHWDSRTGYYDAGHVPTGVTAQSPNFGFAQALKDEALPPGVRFNWGGSNKSGARSLLGGFMKPPLTRDEAANSLAAESYHPYGNTPEAHGWDPAAFAAAQTVGGVFNASLPGSNTGSNMKVARWESERLLAKSGWTISQTVTETGYASADEISKARFDARQFIFLHALGFDRINFYCLYNRNPEYAFVTYDPATKAVTPLPDYIAIHGIMQDVARIGTPPATYTPADLPVVASYKGYYPLAVATIVGRRSVADKRNSMLFVAYQRSYPLYTVTTLNAAATTNASGAADVKLTWTNTSGSLAYKIKRATVSGGPYATIGTVQGATYTVAHQTTSTFTDPNMMSGATYYYIVTALNGAAESGVSNEVKVSTSAPAVADPSSRKPDSMVAFDHLPPTPAVPVTVELPSGTKAVAAWNLTNRAKVAIQTAGRTATFPVTDDAVMLQIDPE